MSGSDEEAEDCEWHLLVVVVLCVHRPQQAPGLHVARLPLHLGLQGQHRLREEAVPEEVLAPSQTVQILDQGTQASEALLTFRHRIDGSLLLQPPPALSRGLCRQKVRACPVN